MLTTDDNPVCEKCDRLDCPMLALDLKHVRGCPRLLGTRCPKCDAEVDCREHAVDWRQETLRLRADRNKITAFLAKSAAARGE